MSESVIVRSFAGGELSPGMAARADLARYAIGARTMRNFLVLRHGGAANRPGFRFVGEAKTTNSNVRLIPYVSEIEGESVVIEAGLSYLRFWLNGGLVTIDIGDVDDWNNATAYVIGDLVKDGGVIYYAIKAGTNHDPPNATYWSPFDGDGTYEIPTPFSGGVPEYSQSGRVITLTRADTPPQELIFEAIDRWVFRAVSTAPGVLPPTGLVLTNTAGTRHAGYVVTAASPETYEESEASAQVIDASAAEATADAPRALSWTAQSVGGVACPEYYIYSDPVGNGQYGYIGTAVGQVTFKDPGTFPDFAQTPPLARVLFNTTDLYPRISAAYQQRRLFGASNATPDQVWGSRVGFASNFGICSPLQDDDAVTFKMAGNNHHAVRHLIDLKVLVALTGAGAFVVAAPDGKSLAPNNIGVNQEGYVGVSTVKPAVLGNTVIYAEARGSSVFEIRFDQAVEGLAGKNLTVFAGHLFDGYTVKALTYALSPNSIMWAVRSDGALLGLTYIPEQDVWGWHRHDTEMDGKFEDAVTVPEAGEDALYVIVARLKAGTRRRYIERLAPRTILNFNADSFFVDAGLSYAGAPVSSVSGLDHLDGEVVAVVGDGTVVYDGDPDGPQASSFTVSGGAVALPAAYANIHVGLPIRFGDLETLDLDVAGSNVRDKRKKVGSVTAILEGSSRGFLVGPSSDGPLTRLVPAAYEATGKSFNGSVELSAFAGWNDNGRVFIRQTDPLPLTILGLIPNLEVGG